MQIFHPCGTDSIERYNRRYKLFTRLQVQGMNAIKAGCHNARFETNGHSESKADQNLQ